MSPEPSLNRPLETSVETSARAALQPVPYAGHFIAFWQAYPRKEGKPVAERAYTKAVKRDGTHDVDFGLGVWLTYWETRNEPEYVPHPATWLNQARYNDTPPQISQRPNKSGVSGYEGLGFTAEMAAHLRDTEPKSHAEMLQRARDVDAAELVALGDGR